MKKLSLIILVSILLGCQKTSNEPYPVEIQIAYFIDSETEQVMTVNKQSEIEKITDYFYKGNSGYQQLRGSEIDFKLTFIDQWGVKTYVEAYTTAMMEEDANFKRLICVNNEEICTEFYANDDFYESMKAVQGNKQEILYHKVIPEQNKAYELLKVINEDVEDTRNLGNDKEVVVALIQLIDSDDIYRSINNHQAATYDQKLYDDPPYDEDFEFYTFEEVENLGKQYLSPEFELKDIVEGEYYYSTSEKVYSDVDKRGFVRVDFHSNNNYDYELIATELIESNDEQLLTFIKAPTFTTEKSNSEDKRRQFIEGNGNLTVSKLIHNSIYDETFDRANEFDQVQITLNNKHIVSVKYLNHVKKERLFKPLSVSDFTLTQEEGLQMIMVDSPNIDARDFEALTRFGVVSVEFKENDQLIDVILKKSGIFKGKEEHYLFEKKTGNNLSIIEMNDLLEGKLVDKISSQLGDTPICPYYYEDAITLDKCYVEPLIIQNLGGFPYDEVVEVSLYINENGKLSIGVILKEKGTFIELKEVVLD